MSLLANTCRFIGNEIGHRSVKKELRVTPRWAVSTRNPSFITINTTDQRKKKSEVKCSNCLALL